MRIIRDEVLQANVAFSPPETAEALKYIITGKVVCDVGCAYGDLLEAFSKYAKKVIGMERYPHRARVARAKGFEVTDGDALKDPIPKADVYYIWTTDNHFISKQIKNGIIIAARENGKDLVDHSVLLEFPYGKPIKDVRQRWHLSIEEK